MLVSQTCNIWVVYHLSDLCASVQQCQVTGKGCQFKQEAVQGMVLKAETWVKWNMGWDLELVPKAFQVKSHIVFSQRLSLLHTSRCYTNVSFQVWLLKSALEKNSQDQFNIIREHIDIFRPLSCKLLLQGYVLQMLRSSCRTRFFIINMQSKNML